MSTLDRRFEGPARLDQLLALAGSVSDTQDVASAFAQAHKDGVPPQVVISALFEDEPRFPSPQDAKALYSNLLGLWDAIAAGQPPDLSAPKQAQKPTRGAAPKAADLPPPGLFPHEGPSDEWLEVAWRYVEGAPKTAVTRLTHAFENRQDALLTWLDESGVGDQVYGAARQILFELFAMLELGTSGGIGRIESTALTGDAAGVEVPVALAAWAQEAVFQAATDEEEPLGEENARQLGALVTQALRALWAHRVA